MAYYKEEKVASKSLSSKVTDLLKKRTVADNPFLMAALAYLC